jgi:hypothetical protein
MQRLTTLVIASISALLGTAFSGRIVAADGEAAPIVSLTNHCLLGGVANGRWLTSRDVAPRTKDGEQYRVYGLKGLITQSTGNSASSVGAPCDETLDIKIRVPQGKGASIALGGQWNASPRPVAVLDKFSVVYRPIVGTLLQANGISAAEVSLNQVLRTDLEGDGQEEVLISASRHSGGLGAESKAGDYSMILLRKIVNGKVEAIPVVAEYHPTKGNFDAPNEYGISAILDINGDGVMEIVVDGKYYEGEWTTVYTLNGSKIEKALECGCGA